MSADAITKAGRGLLRHAQVHYTDWMISRDMDCILSECVSAADMLLIKRYARLRRRAPGFDGHRAVAANNHGRIKAVDLAALMPTMAKIQPRRNDCENCGESFAARRADARTCSPKCRKAASRVSHIGGRSEAERPTTPERQKLKVLRPLTCDDAALSVTRSTSLGGAA